jgi:hypothetical protein
MRKECYRKEGLCESAELECSAPRDGDHSPSPNGTRRLLSKSFRYPSQIIPKGTLTTDAAGMLIPTNKLSTVRLSSVHELVAPLSLL